MPKDDARVAAYGDIDELQAMLGVIKSETPADSPLAALLKTIQRDLFSLSARLADPKDRSPERKDKVVTGDSRIEALEREIDAREAELPPLKAFILAGGGPSGRSSIWRGRSAGGPNVRRSSSTERQASTR